MTYSVDSEVNRLIYDLENLQSNDGAWRFCFETGPMTDSYMMILLRTLMIHDTERIKSLAERIIQLQEPHGGWNLYKDEYDGNLSATIEAYYALSISGLYNKADPKLKAARNFIISRRNTQRINILTQTI